MFANSFSYYAEHLRLSELYLLSLGLLNISSTYLRIKPLKCSGLLCLPPSLTLKKIPHSSNMEYFHVPYGYQKAQ